MMSFNPDQLMLARQRCGYSKRQLAAAVECTERTIGDWERGAFPPNDANIAKLSRVLKRPRAFFFLDTPERLPAAGVSFRAMSRLRASDQHRATALARMALSLDLWLTEQFNRPQPDVPDLAHLHAQPEAAASTLRSRWGLGDKPVASMISLLEYRGIRVYSLAEDCRELNAFAFWQGDLPYVFLNNNRSSEASRFDAAHELGHLVLHQHGVAGGRQAEDEANAFAGAFLMPASSIAAHAPRTHSIPRLIDAKGYWNVSLSALSHRLHELGWISDWNYRSLCIEIQKAGYRQCEPNSAPREGSQVFQKIFASLDADGLTRRDIAAILGWTSEELTAVTFGTVLRASAGGSRSSEVTDARGIMQLLK